MSRRQRARRDARRRRAALVQRAARRVTLGAGLTASAVVASGGAAQAADFTVTNVDDSGDGSLRDAIADANAAAGADRILFQSVLSGDIFFQPGSTEMAITGPVEIIGNAPGEIGVDALGNDRVFNVAAGDGNLVAISNLDINGGTEDSGAGGGNILLASGDLTLERTNITGGTTSSPYADGGGVNATDPDSTLTILSTWIDGSDVVGSGGGISTNGADLVVRDSTISNNDANGTAGLEGDGAGLYATDSAVTIERSTVSGNEAANLGGGLFLGDGVTATIDNSTVARNTSQDRGGGIEVAGATTLALTSTIISENSVSVADGADLFREAPSTVNSTASLITDSPAGTINGTDQGNLLGNAADLNDLESNGGLTQTHSLDPDSEAVDQGISATDRDQRGAARPVDDAGTPNSTVPGADGTDIGAFEIQADGTQQVTNVSDAGTGSLHSAMIASNDFDTPNDVLFDSGLTGTIPTTNGELEVLSPVEVLGPGADQVTLDASGGGRGFYVYPGSDSDAVAIAGLTISGGNRPEDYGGGIVHLNGELTLYGLAVTGNTAGGYGYYQGGGIASVDGADELGLISSTVSGNHAFGDGGGIYVGAGSAGLFSSTVSGNTTEDDGGGLYLYGDVNTLEDVTIAGNHAAYDGGGVVAYPTQTSSFSNTLVADNTAGTGPDLAGSASAEFSLFEDPGAEALITETVPDSNVFGVDPVLGPLALNGGTTPSHALGATSPAIDQGLAEDSPDQRGIARPLDFASIPNSTALGADGSDIGAFELDVEPPLPPGDGGGTTPTTPVQPVSPTKPKGKAKRKCKKRKKKGKAGSAIARAAKKCKRRKKR
jgi:hypothetical protein